MTCSASMMPSCHLISNTNNGTAWECWSHTWKWDIKKSFGKLVLAKCCENPLVMCVSCISVHEKTLTHQTFLMILQSVWWLVEFVQNHQTYCLIIWQFFCEYLNWNVWWFFSKCLMICSESSDILWSLLSLLLSLSCVSTIASDCFRQWNLFKKT